MKTKIMNNVDSIFKTVAAFGNILVKHRVHILTLDKSGHSLDYVYKFTSSKSRGGRLGYPSTFFNSSDDGIVLENIPKDKDTDKIKISVYLTYNDISELIRIFEESRSWFEKYKNDLFEYDKNGIPYNVNQKYSELHAIMRLRFGIKGSFLAIQPAVILDSLNNTGYPGVILKSNTGCIGTCTITEFFSLQEVVINLMKNLYQISNELVNQYLLTEIGGL